MTLNVVMSTTPVTYTGSPIPLKSFAHCTAMNNEGTIVTGAFAFAEDPINVSDSGMREVIFTPTDTEKYEVATTEIQITINPATLIGYPVFTAKDGSDLKAGDTLADVVYTTANPWPEGTLTWILPVDTVIVGGQTYEWTYTPIDGNYNSLTYSSVLAKKVVSGGGGFTPTIPKVDPKINFNVPSECTPGSTFAVSVTVEHPTNPTDVTNLPDVTVTYQIGIDSEEKPLVGGTITVPEDAVEGTYIAIFARTSANTKYNAVEMGTGLTVVIPPSPSDKVTNW